MLDLTTYQKYLIFAYIIGVIIQVIALYILSIIHHDKLSFGSKCAIFYVFFATLQFVLFLKVIEEKGEYYL